MSSRGFRAVSDHLVLLQRSPSAAECMTFHSRVKSPGSLTSKTPVNGRPSFRAVPDHLVLLRQVRAEPLHLCFTAVLNHLVLLLRSAERWSSAVSEACQTTWFSYTACPCSPSMSFHGRAESPGSLTPWHREGPACMFQSRTKLPGSPALDDTSSEGFVVSAPNHQYTHPHTGTRATTAKDSPRGRASPHALRTHARRPRRVLHAERGRPSCCPRAIQARANRAGEVSGPLGRVPSGVSHRQACPARPSLL